jgi:hypothetical protein
MLEKELLKQRQKGCMMSPLIIQGDQIKEDIIGEVQ